MIRAIAGRLLRLTRPPAPPAPPMVNRWGVDDPTVVIHANASIHRQDRPDSIRIGSHSHICGQLLVFGHGGNIVMGSRCYVGEQTRIWSAAEIRMGDRVLISHLCTIMDNLTHPTDKFERRVQAQHLMEQGFPKDDFNLGERPIVIEDDVLIGCHCLVLRGVTIGQGAVIGAGSVVTSDIPPNTVFAGNPARFIRTIEQGEGSRMALGADAQPHGRFPASPNDTGRQG